MKTEVITLNEERKVTLTAYLLDAGGEFSYIEKRPAIVVLPGGGYAFCSDREADPVALPYLKAGYQAFILRYSVGEDSVWPNPLNDFDRAMDLIKEKAEEWHVYADKIAVIGFSAGGHLAAAAATMAKNRPQAAILGYPVVTEDVKACNPSAPSLIDQVDALTPPCFLFHTRTDNVVPIHNSIDFIAALDQAGISFESHIYSYGPHGYSTNDSSVQMPGTEITPRVGRWVEDSIDWLHEVLGDFSAEGGMTKPVVRQFVNADHDAYLSIDCTMGHLTQNPKAMAVLGPMMEKMKAAMVGSEDGAAKVEKGEEAGVAEMVGRMKLRDILGYSKVPPQVLDQLNEALSQIKND